jgi:hypothetical protein
MSPSLAVLQPSYLPWPGYFNQISRVNTFVFLDDVQYDKNGWRNRNRILFNDNLLWLTIPIYQKNKFGQLLKEVKINYEINWMVKHLNTIKHAYGKCAYFDDFYPPLEKIILKKTENLVDLNIEIILLICNFFSIECNFHKSSELHVGGDKNSKLVGICKKLGCKTYLTGNSAVNYINLDCFKNNSINVVWQDFNMQIYPKEDLFKGNFLSVISLIFKYGRNSLDFIKQ